MARRPSLTLRPPRLPDPVEAIHQQRLFERVAIHQAQYPELSLLFAVPNGGWRHKATAAALQRQGVRRGVPDMFLPVPRAGYAGLWIELKRIYSGSLTETQEWWLQHLTAQGYRAICCRGCDGAWQEIIQYLALPAPAIVQPPVH